MAQSEVERLFDAVAPLFTERIEEELGQTSLTQMAAVVEGLAFNRRTHAVLITYGPADTMMLYAWRQSPMDKLGKKAVRKAEDEWVEAETQAYEAKARIERIAGEIKQRDEEHEMALFERQVTALEQGADHLDEIQGGLKDLLELLRQFAAGHPIT